MRSNISFHLVCSECQNPLECDSDKNRIEYPGAYDANCFMRIKPCPYCMKKIKEPIRLLKEILK